MSRSDAELEAMLADLDAAMPQILDAGGDFWRVFGQWTDPIKSEAHGTQSGWVATRIDDILEAHCNDIPVDQAPADYWPGNDVNRPA